MNATAVLQQDHWKQFFEQFEDDGLGVVLVGEQDEEEEQHGAVSSDVDATENEVSF